jgi:DNA-binding SARP family transcriptional activator
MLHLVTFGGLALESVNEAVAPRLTAQRLAILAVLAAEGDRRVSRERLTGLFWPDADEERARHSLRQALYTLRQEIGHDIVRSDFVLSLDRSAITSDVAQFREALARGDRASAGKLVRGPFLNGFYLPSAAPFQRWVEEERARLHSAATTAISGLAADAIVANDLDGAVTWWRQLTELDPLSGRFALGYLKVLAARGDRAEALAVARSHAALVRRELETEPDAEIRTLEASLRMAPAPPAIAIVPDASDRGGRDPEKPTKALVTAASMAPTGRQRKARHLTRYALGVGAIVAAIMVFRATVWSRPESARASSTSPTFAVGVIRDDAPDSTRLGRALTDMLSTNLASVPGLQVIANSRLLELIPPGDDTSAEAYSNAARQAGATELLEGRMLERSASAFTMEMRRVDLRSGLLKGVYRASATTRFRLVDSMTASVARQLQLSEPPVPKANVTTRSATAYRLYEEALRAYYLTDYATAAHLIRAALDDDSTFAMAAFYDALLHFGEGQRDYTERALRLARGATERERLMITAHLTGLRNGAPGALAVAESLATRYPNDARALEVAGGIRQYAGDWAGAADALRRAVALDSSSREPRAPCRLCEDLRALTNVYWWWDSLPASARTAQTYIRLHPDWPQTWDLLVWTAAKSGDSATAREALRRFTRLQSTPRSTGYEARINLLLDSYDNLEADLRPLLESPKRDDYNEARWWLLIALRNQGRLRDARLLNETGRLATFGAPQAWPIEPESINRAIIAFESGDTRAAAARFVAQWQQPLQSGLPPGSAARYHAWRGTLAGMAVAATGDTAAVLRLADSVEYWGQRSLFGRDRKAHHYLRGLVHVAGGRDEDAIREFRQAIDSYTLGLTRVNLELGRALLRRDRAAEAASVVAPALRGEVDASNLYVTRTELHELLAEAYDKAQMADSAAAHYRVVVRSWSRADPAFHARREVARAWLTRHKR